MVSRWVVALCIGAVAVLGGCGGGEQPVDVSMDQVAGQDDIIGPKSIKASVKPDRINVFGFTCGTATDYDIVTCERIIPAGDPDLYVYDSFASSGKTWDSDKGDLIGHSNLFDETVDWTAVDTGEHGGEQVIVLVHGYGPEWTQFRVQRDPARELAGTWSARRSLKTQYESDWWHFNAIGPRVRVQVRVLEPSGGEARVEAFKNFSRRPLGDATGESVKLDFDSPESRHDVFVRVNPSGSGYMKYRIRWLAL